jgi:hypothetical protein
MNLEKRLQSAAQELNNSAQRTSPPPLRPASEQIRPWLAFAAALAVVLAVFGIPYALTNFGQGNPPNSAPLAGAGSTTTECVAPETTSTSIEEDGSVSTFEDGSVVITLEDGSVVITLEDGSVSTLPPTTEASEAADEESGSLTTDCPEPGATTTVVEPIITPDEVCPANELYPPTTVANGDPSFDLTEPVKEKLTRIAEMAAGCNATGLAALASDDIVTTYGPGSGPEDIASWQPDDERFGIIAELFNMTHGVTGEDGSRIYVWPAAFAYETWDEIPDAAMDELLRIYSQEELDQISLLGSYGGWRIGITEAGEWIFFVAGD